ncbi:DNA replication/repair protein RecF [Spongiibacter sp. KMU-158]|uniref:DNA replication and repair protein RecF n=1 Tax=Spongiibacter pelagi TaxID=2760804 RepID=A0A927GV78_9GAMM|nr:DNA replication/repair protein RecF [Spongiibacter pelagi]MBD2857597.1 DNA replication/repair protein RecF [Spongiibacter pelagi]
MQLNSLDIHNFRNISKARLSDLGPVNLIHGLNGSGKTSVLEAVYSLSMTRSFRTRKTKLVIREGERDFIVRGLISALGETDYSLGVRRSLDDKSLVKVSGEAVRSFGQLAGLLPVQLINPDSFDLLEGGPGNRRQFLDWPMFHVKHSGFFEAWSRYRKALSQRNALLRRGKMGAEIEPWSMELVRHGKTLDEIRRSSFNAVAPVFDLVCQRLGESTVLGADDGERPAAENPFSELKLDYQPGWDQGISDFELALSQALEGDVRQGFTRVGPHRADVKLKIGRVDAAERLSRGQIKTVVCALKIAQAKWLKEEHNIDSVFLIDDIAAELDQYRRAALIEQILDVASQVFATSIEPSELDSSWFQGRQIKRFHVEHGVVNPVATTE